MRTGLQVFLDQELPGIARKKAGLITNHSAVDHQLRSAVDLLYERDIVDLVALFGPEHGVRGDAQAGVEIESAIDHRTGLPVYSLYGDRERPEPGVLADIDVLLFDVQDVGVRYATYISTMLHAMEAATEAGVTFVVLDRPNPLGGVRIEGNLLDPAFSSFVGVHPVPIRHGMTVGQLARLFNAELNLAEPVVVEMDGWRREQWFDETGLPWVQPSPNLPTLESVTLYPGTCLIEGTNVSEGRGTTKPFEYIGAPWIDPFELANEMTNRELPGCLFRPAFFTPTFSKFAEELCGGIQIHVVDRDELRPVELGVHLVDVIRTLYPQEFAWRQSSDGAYYFIDRLLGTDNVRLALENGLDAVATTRGWDNDVTAFEKRRRAFLIYS